MTDPSGRYTLVFNGEVYNYRELKTELDGKYDFRTSSDTEVVLAALICWGAESLNKFIGMFSFLLWDELKQELLGARDRFGIKPLFYCELGNGQIAIASEIKALQTIVSLTDLNLETWISYLSGEIYDSGPQTFWNGIFRVPGGHTLRWSPRKEIVISSWYTLTIDDYNDDHSDESAIEAAQEILCETVALRLRSDVRVGICLSGGLDSSLVAALAAKARLTDTYCDIAFSFSSNSPKYDEVPFAQRVAQLFGFELVSCDLRAEEVPSLAKNMYEFQDEPFGGIPTLGMGKVFESARQLGVPVLLDGNGLDEAFAGYEYYSNLQNWSPQRAPVQSSLPNSEFVDVLAGSSDRPKENPPAQGAIHLTSAQIQDLLHSKIPRAMRFSDRASMMFSCELREPFLDHRLVEFGLSQPRNRKIGPLGGKQLIRQVAKSWLPSDIRLAPKRPVQTPQHEWLRTELFDWVSDLFSLVSRQFGASFLDRQALNQLLTSYHNGRATNSYQIWTIVSLGLAIELRESRRSVFKN